MAKVSVIIPAFNSASFIRETIGSALALDHDDIEVLVIDDGSTDQTFAIAKGQAEAEDRLLVFRQENAGDSAARNTGLKNCHGDYLIFLDHDDLLHPDAVRLHLAAMESRPGLDMVLGSNLLIDSGGEIIGENRLQQRRFGAHDVVLGTTPSFSQCMYRRDALERIGGLRPEAKSAADHDLNIRLLADEDAGYIHDGIVMLYRMHDGQQTKSPSKLYRMHMAVLVDLLGDGGELENRQLLAKATDHWNRYYGKFLPSEFARAMLRGDFAAMSRSALLFVQCLPQSALCAADFWHSRARAKKLGSQRS